MSLIEWIILGLIIVFFAFLVQKTEELKKEEEEIIRQDELRKAEILRAKSDVENTDTGLDARKDK